VGTSEQALSDTIRQTEAVERALLNDLPYWALILLIVGIVVLVALGGFALTRTRLSRWSSEASSQTVIGVTAIAMTFFALLLALVIVDLYTAFKNAEADVTTEANTLAKIIQDADAFPPPNEEAVRQAVDNYVREVRDQEFPAMRDGREPPNIPAQLLRISVALRGYTPENQTQISFYDSAVSQVNDLVDERDDRVSTADSAVPGALTALLLVLGAVSLVTTFFVRTHHHSLDLVLVFSIAIIIGLGIVTTLILEYPFSGSIAVSSAPFQHVATFSGLTQGP
jgi:VIT1/CCC1 family predicted Fe2+/Mn2+ transporter